MANGNKEASEASAPVTDEKPKDQEASNKRAREDEGGADEVPPKRLDQKEEVGTTAS